MLEKNMDEEKVVTCKKCGQDFMHTKENTKCSFCYTEYSEKTEEETQETKTTASLKKKKEEKQEEKKITARQRREFRKFSKKMKEETEGNFRQRAEAIGVSPEDVKDFKYWLIDNRE